MPSTSVQRIGLAFIVLMYLVVALAFAVRVPAWQTPDEPAHYNYIMQLAEQVRLPVIEMGDWDQTYLERLSGSRFDPALLDNLDAVQYEDHQPPLYYVLAAPVYLLTGSSLTALRIFSAAWGVLIVLSAFAIGKLMFPDRPWIGLSAAAFVAFLPQHVHILASVNNDALGWAIIAVTLAAAVAYVKPIDAVKPWQLGVLVGLGFLTKATTYFLAPLVVLALLLRWWLERPADADAANRRLVRSFAVFAFVALGFGMIWWVRNIDVYGFPDVLGLREHDTVVVGQPRTAELIDRLGWGAYLKEIASVTLNSFIGRFGWMGVPVQGWSYTLVLTLMAAGLVGVVMDVLFLRRRAASARAPSQRAAWMLLLATIVLSVLAYLYYNVEFQQHQGRYMYPMLIPLGILLALGIDAWRRVLVLPVARSDGAVVRASGWLTLAIFLALAPLSMWLLWRVVVPNLAY
jgi:4-amino-4-deoxy-L-arabinose transferase-like glycosyltransferase